MSNEGPSDLAASRHGKQDFLFNDAGLSSPIEELRAIFEKKLRTAQNLGEAEKAQAYQEAYELARKRLAAAMGTVPSPLGPTEGQRETTV